MFSPWWYTLFIELLILFPISSQVACPNGVKVRKEWRTLSRPVRHGCVRAIAKYIKENPDDFLKFGRIHSEHAGNGIHGSGHFLPWHRYFTWEFEKTVARLGGDPDYTQHYWDATPQAQEALRNSPIFDREVGLGLLTPDCISFGGLTTLNDTSEECVRRSDGFRVVDGISIVVRLLNHREEFADLTTTLEGGYHSQVHAAIGGHMVSSASPVDPIFFFHHSQIDHLWSLWQSMKFGIRLTQFNYQSDHFRHLEKLDSKLLAYPDFTVNDVMDISKLCYRYDGIPVKPSPAPPSAKSVPSIPTPPTNTNPPSNPIPSTYLILPGLPEGIALDSALMDPNQVRTLKGNSGTVIKKMMPELQKYYVSIPRLPTRPDWCLITPGLPSGKCIDKRTLDKESVEWWSMASFDYVEEYWSVISKSVVSIPGTLSKRSPSGSASKPIPKGKDAPAAVESLKTKESAGKNVRSGCIIDLGEICMLKFSAPVPEFWIKFNRLNLSLIRENERKNEEFVRKLNNFEGLIPESALANHPDIIKKRIEESLAGPNCKICCLAKGIRVEVPFQKDTNTTAINLCELAKEVGRKGVEKPTPKALAKLIGIPLLPPNAFSNPFHQCSSSQSGK